jgi:hypothetical protein
MFAVSQCAGDADAPDKHSSRYTIAVLHAYSSAHVRTN